MRECVVMVIGTGAAGLRAAYELRSTGVEVVVVSKGAAVPSGSTPSASFSYCCASPDDPRNSAEQFQQDLVRSAATMSDPHLIEVMCRDGYRRLQDLASLGVPWTRAEHGALARVQLPGHSVRRAFHVDFHTGMAMSRALLKACLRVGVKFVQYHMALDLVLNDGRLSSVVLLDVIDGCATTWRCDAVIVATGGAAALFRLHTNPPGQTGDGMAIVLRAGGELVDMEFVQMYPTVLVSPPSAYGIAVPTEGLLTAGARLLNRVGDEFIPRWEGRSIGQATRDLLARAIASEIATAGPTDAGGIYLDATRVCQKTESARHFKFLKELGADIFSDLQQVAPGAHYSLGGIRVVPPASCMNLPGVFAAGEVAGGVHGANRLAGCALTDTQVFGASAAHEATDYLVRSHTSAARGGSSLIGAESWPTKKGESHIWDVICEARHRQTGLKPGEIRAVLQDSLQQCMSATRSGRILEGGLTQINQLQQAYHTKLVLPRRSGRWYPELLNAAELANMLDIAPGMLATALVRTESRGAHFRVDYPYEDRGWDENNLVLAKSRGSLIVSRCSRESGERKVIWP